MICCEEAVYIDRFICIRAEGVKNDLAMERTGADTSTADTVEEEGEEKDNSGADVHVALFET